MTQYIRQASCKHCGGEIERHVWTDQVPEGVAQYDKTWRHCRTRREACPPPPAPGTHAEPKEES